MGRPSLGDSAKRHMVTMRATSQLRDRIEAEAQRNERSMSQEIEHRLEQSFREEDALGGPRHLAFHRFLAATIQSVELTTERPWFDDYATFLAVRRAIAHTVDRFGPPLPAEVIDAGLRGRFADQERDRALAAYRRHMAETPNDAARGAELWARLEAALAAVDAANEECGAIERSDAPTERLGELAYQMIAGQAFERVKG